MLCRPCFPLAPADLLIPSRHFHNGFFPAKGCACIPPPGGFPRSAVTSSLPTGRLDRSTYWHHSSPTSLFSALPFPSPLFRCPISIPRLTLIERAREGGRERESRTGIGFVPVVVSGDEFLASDDDRRRSNYEDSGSSSSGSRGRGTMIAYKRSTSQASTITGPEIVESSTEVSVFSWFDIAISSKNLKLVRSKLAGMNQPQTYRESSVF